MFLENIGLKMITPNKSNFTLIKLRKLNFILIRKRFEKNCQFLQEFISVYPLDNDFSTFSTIFLRKGRTLFIKTGVVCIIIYNPSFPPTLSM